MMGWLWLRGLTLRRPGRLLGTIAGVALTVALPAAIGAFIAQSAATMTDRAIHDVPVDWQVQLAPGTDPATIQSALGRTAETVDVVGYAGVTGLTALTKGSTQTTGAGVVLGVGPTWSTDFPGEIRALVGPATGVMVAQQTAANLHVGVGDTVTIQRVGGPDADVRIDGVIDLPNADSLFQAVGVPAGAGPQAPPDNVLVLPMDLWHTLFDTQAVVRPDSVHLQLHARIVHDLPPDPGDAFLAVEGRARNLEARISGSGLVGDNLAARLDGVREDALYARVLFLFLGLPGAILALLLTLEIAASGGQRRQHEQALLRTRGASTSRILRLAGIEAMAAGIPGTGLGLGLAAGATALVAPGSHLFGAESLPWTIGAAILGLVLATCVVLLPAWHQARTVTVASARATIGRAGTPLWERLGLDFGVLALAAFASWRTASTGYAVVLAPEGVSQTSVSYAAFVAPLGLWLGAALLALRLWRGGLVWGRRPLAFLLRPLARGLSAVAVASLGRQRTRIARAAVMVTLAFSFASSTAIFNTTYNAQSVVDAELTNGADVSVTGSSASPAGAVLSTLTALPRVAGIATLQHRFAYVGSDLQDLYGIDVAHIGEATTMANAYFAGGDARATLGDLAAHEDGVLVSQETVNDFQLVLGDPLNLRLQDARDHQYKVVPFHFRGVAREFPTAPHDSFLVANATYVSAQTGSDAAEIVLLRAKGDPADLATAVTAALAGNPALRVSDIATAQHTISSSLTSVDLRGLTRLELGFAILLVAGATGLALALGLAERRRTFAILAALGAKPAQLGAFLWSEGLLVLVGGMVVGLALGVGVAALLVKVLTGVFDPPPDALAVPWAYLGLLVACGAGTTVLAILGALRASRSGVIAALREM